VDPRVNAEHKGLFQARAEDGSRYLRRMKEQSVEADRSESAPATDTGSPVRGGPPRRQRAATQSKVSLLRKRRIPR
jgi:hypothetical protein